MRWILALLLPLSPAAMPAGEAADTPSGKQLFETHCAACHSLDLPKSQHLDRANWKWVIDDMVNQFGATWLTEEQQKLILDYLVEHQGPAKPRQFEY